MTQAVSAVNQNLLSIPDASFFHNIAAGQIRCLDLSFNNITSFLGLSTFPNVEELILDNNDISDIGSLEQVQSLKLLSINNNKITELETFLSVLEQCMPSLTYLSCLGNPCCPDQLTDSENTEDDYRRYRYYVVYRFPRLRFLDSKQVSPKERSEAQRNGPFLRRIRISVDATSQPKEQDDSSSYIFHPLPKNTHEMQESAAYRPCRYVYRGIHSEGNRFIRDNQL